MDDHENVSGKDKEMEEFMQLERQKAEVTALLHEFNEICWEKCIGKPSSKLDQATQVCLSNCVDRFIDTSVLIAKRFVEVINGRQ
ncbi:mitochondrial import inner membrane translocase subunit Tim8-like [Drosophila pseudoobscura]|uniref:Mitochondrial import inner membrane translocase subunit n=1 Tax=Drosophila pseudoobscura pseudoobscura TaxID=46245 RepID=B5DII8_DROPS|nr:mitochondrial import inner membrane translocase subunit Tim8 [Drosophila pseudoobscura]